MNVKQVVAVIIAISLVAAVFVSLIQTLRFTEIDDKFLEFSNCCDI